MQSAYEYWAHELTSTGVRQQFRDLGCDLVLVKVLGRNNNSKQQVWLASHLNELAMLPFGSPRARPGSSTKRSDTGAIFHCDVDFSWIGPTGVTRAPTTKLVYHPQYPEVRLSGFLQGCPTAPSHLMRIEDRGKEEGRVLLMGINQDSGAVYGILVGADAPLAAAMREMHLEKRGILMFWPLKGHVAKDPRRLLLAEICGVARGGWFPGQRLTRSGLVPYRARNGGGYTIEALLGITANSNAAPDRHGHEIKQFGVTSMDRPRRTAITLFDIVPDGGEFQRLGAGDFIRARGHLNPQLRRFDFAGVHRLGHTPPRTGARLSIEGYDGENLQADGSVGIVANDETVLMSWSFAKLMDHWGRKHALAAYIPSENRDVTTAEGTIREYRFGQTVYLGTGTDFTFFLDALRDGTVRYDPGMHAPATAGDNTIKVRSLFRISSADLSRLYREFASVDACTPSLAPEVEDGPAIAA
jgi:hypothetical protein